MVCSRNYQEAADKFSVAIRYNPAEVHYYENRAKAYSKVDKTEEAKMDAIRVLILEPTNDQVSLSLSRSQTTGNVPNQIWMKCLKRFDDA